MGTGGVPDALEVVHNYNACLLSSHGHVCVVSLVGSHPSVVLNNSLHSAHAVSALCWMQDSSRLFVGDAAGRISSSRINVTASLSSALASRFRPLPFQNRNLFRGASELILQLDSSIVQLDYSPHSLLISTMTRSCLHQVSRYVHWF